MTAHRSDHSADYDAVALRLGDALKPLGFHECMDGMCAQRGDVDINVYVYRPSSPTLPPEVDIEVAIGVSSGPDHALVYLSTWQWAHGDLRRYRPRDRGWPGVVNDEFEEFALPELRRWAGAADVVEALLQQRVPPNRGIPVAHHATSAWALAQAAGLEQSFSERATTMVESTPWPNDVADELEWFRSRFGMPMRVSRAAKPMGRRK